MNRKAGFFLGTQAKLTSTSDGERLITYIDVERNTICKNTIASKAVLFPHKEWAIVRTILMKNFIRTWLDWRSLHSMRSNSYGRGERAVINEIPNRSKNTITFEINRPYINESFQYFALVEAEVQTSLVNESTT